MNALRILTAAALSLAIHASAYAADYPTKVVTFIVPFPPGGATDATTRITTQKMQESFGQPIVIENKAGANGSSELLRSPGRTPTVTRC
jgi:tripartite-type tricarboxylate transporter receptor subunit TctC